VQDRKLVVIDSEVETVRSIFRRYAGVGSVRLFEAHGIKSKVWTTASHSRPTDGAQASVSRLARPS
jgi:hypothetical protein